MNKLIINDNMPFLIWSDYCIVGILNQTDLAKHNQT